MIRTWMLTIALTALIAGCDSSPTVIPVESSTATPTVESPTLPPADTAAPYLPGDETLAKLAEARAKRAKQKPSRIMTVAQQTAPVKQLAPGKMGAVPGSGYPPSWSITDWYVDEQNATGLASDSNDCQTSTTPCLHSAEIIRRWGTSSPILQVEATIHGLSAWSTSSPQSYTPLFSSLTIEGPLGAAQQTGTGTLSGVTAKNAATRQLLTATLTAGLAVDQLIHNTTHDSWAWTFKNTSGSTYSISQPFDLTPAEVNTWANGDAFVVYAPVGFTAAEVGNLVTVSAVDTSSTGFIQLPTAIGYDRTVIGSNFYGNEVFTPIFANCPILINTFLPGSARITGGYYKGANNMQGTFTITGDFIDDGLHCILQARSFVSQLWIVDANRVDIYGDVNLCIGGGTSNCYITGNGAVDVRGNGVLKYPTTANAAVAVFLSSAAQPLLIDSSATAHSTFTIAPDAGTTPSQDVGCGNVALTPTLLDTAASATCPSTGFGGRAYMPGGGSIINANQTF